MKQYLDLLKDIMDNGSMKGQARPGMPATKEVFCRMMKFNLQDGFPLVTTKKMHMKGIIAELLWFLSGSTNIKYLVDNGCNIWNADAYKYYKRIGGELATLSFEEFVDAIKIPSCTIRPFADKCLDITKIQYHLGDCGQIYGHQWKKWGYSFDQITNLVDSIKKNPDSRYHIVTAWNPTNFIQNQNDAALPACHVYFQCSVRDGKYLDLMLVQRSCDTMLGVPYNIASYALLLTMLSQQTGYLPGEFSWVGNSVHLYENHFDAVKEQLTRTPRKLPHLAIVDRNQQSIFNYEISDFKIFDYDPHPAIKAELSVGI